MKEYQNYIFDLYGTLIDIQTNEESPSLWKSLAKIYSCFGASYTADALKATYASFCLEEKEKFTCPFPEIDLAKVFANLYVKKGIFPEESLVYYTGNTFRVLSREKFNLYPGITDLLQDLKKKHKHIYLLSNAQRIFTWQELTQLGLIPYFDGIFISSDFGIKKPNPDYLKKLISTYSLDPSKCIMIGNEIASDIAIANQCNIDSLYIRTQTFEPLKDDIGATYCVLNQSLADFYFHQA